jgi:hypothetical protein
MLDTSPSDPEAVSPTNQCLHQQRRNSMRGDVTIGGDVVGMTRSSVIPPTKCASCSKPPSSPRNGKRRWQPRRPDELDAHYKTVVKAFSDGRVVPFLGIGANLCGRPVDAQWQSHHYLPSDAELAEYLADNFGYPAPNRRDLLRVAQYIAVMNGVGPLYENLRALFDADYAPTALIAKGYPPRHQLIVTTNYDDLMERTFKAVGEPFDVVSYIAETARRGNFVHWPHGEEPRLIDKPNEYAGLPIEMPACNLKRSIILKLHGAVDRANADMTVTSSRKITTSTTSRGGVSHPVGRRLKKRTSVHGLQSARLESAGNPAAYLDGATA